ncbi:MAG: AAA family ATPase [Chloroflexi bacterium AL-W]|nr:AAA family ATPase [Chloroflexi bacterium AL-W]
MELNTLLTKLKRDHWAAQRESICEQAAQRALDDPGFVPATVWVAWQGRDRWGIETRFRQARFLWITTLDQFDVAVQPSLDRRQVRELAGLRLVERTHNSVILGPPEVGKTQWPHQQCKASPNS